MEYIIRELVLLYIELLTKRFTSITKAIHQHETYKTGTRDRSRRQLGTILDTYNNDFESEDIEVKNYGKMICKRGNIDSD